MSKINDQLLGHAEENDGIEEYDNPLPDWWLGLFFFSVVFAVGYTVDYHLLSERSQEKSYLAAMEAAAERWPEQEVSAELAFDAQTLEDGAQIFAQTCASCHGADLTGGIGPSLVDAEWIHGSEPQQVVTTITEGVSAKGMPAWGPVLGPEKVQKVAAYVLSEGDAAAGPGGVGPSDDEPPDEAKDPEPSPADAAEAVDETEARATGGAEGDALAQGEQIYAQNCASCHGPDMKGLVGPNLLDDEWIHGGELEQIEATITNGVPAKGMVSWGPILGEEKIRQVATWVHTRSNGG